MSDEELLFVVDENDNALEPLPRKYVIQNKIWRRTAGVVLIDKENRKVLCQRRSDNKDERPGVWITEFGGKSAYQEAPEETVIREIKEEIDIVLHKQDLRFYKKIKAEDRKQFEYMYWALWSGDISKLKYDKEEISEIAWYPAREVLDHLENDPRWYAYGYETDLFAVIDKNLSAS